MKKMIFAITVATTLLCACGNSTAPEERGQDERLFGRSPIYSRGQASWGRYVNGVSTAGVSFSDSINTGTTAGVGFGRQGFNWESYDWYTDGGNIYIRKIERVFSDGHRTPDGSDVTFRYRISGDTLTLSNGPKEGQLAQFGGNYIYYDRDAWCDTSGRECRPR